MLHDIYSIYAIRKIDALSHNRARLHRIFPPHQMHVRRGPAQIFHAKCSRLTMRDHYCRFCYYNNFFLHIYRHKFSDNFHISRGRYAIAREIGIKKYDRKIHIVHARTANSCHAVNFLTIIIINFYWIYIFFFFSLPLVSFCGSLHRSAWNEEYRMTVDGTVFSGKECYLFGALLPMTREQTTMASKVPEKKKNERKKKDSSSCLLVRQNCLKHLILNYPNDVDWIDWFNCPVLLCSAYTVHSRRCKHFVLLLCALVSPEKNVKRRFCLFMQFYRFLSLCLLCLCFIDQNNSNEKSDRDRERER